ncbi:hypothetical protein M406DRAFT_337121 [Cryphonectria parasitica EP155]|uniref:Autophagy-related protein 29 n=1 Tax=Cryphonectria parasitica (strain ATCC 38755 / EP155) TaxID=660469 RepID=A0A9P4Y931_CRYP1|nr:uncharacterized protein M406DRAFT_337121 [Cryphonectria parasitica EP155]KAF3768758.1 hypothetical protein M406DRAFT_337121 [Cryphonectria parasitica EP155]
MDNEPSYVVYIRLPFPRGDFVDPPPVHWDSSKDEALWKIISGVAKTEIDCTPIQFEVSVDFLFQQVTYLQERHTSQLRAQLRKATVAARSSAAPSPAPGSEPSTAMARTPSGRGVPVHARAPSQLSIRRDTPVPRADASLPSTPKAGPASSIRLQTVRASSLGTAAQLGGGQGGAAGSLRLRAGTQLSSPRIQSGRQWHPSMPGIDPSTPVSDVPTPVPAAGTSSPGPADSSSEGASSDESSGPEQSRIIRRPPRFQQQQQNANRDAIKSSFLQEVDEEEAEPAFLPFKARSSGAAHEGSGDGSGQYTDPGATLRGDPRDFAANAARRLQNVTSPDSSQGKGKGKEREKERRLHKSGTSDSSSGSAAFVSKRSPGDRRQPSGPLSPRRTVELKGKGFSREGSEGTPSMGSSFSDLDDASVTQSALEEALASNMQGGNTIGSTISNVFSRSRYLPK